ncbi:MAG: hypothetical protein EB060_08240 [Proteobacteria bacterium]|nr:hypothetical protein [Pseudomonadota bacterium]
MSSSYQTYHLLGKEYTVGGSHRAELADLSRQNPQLGPLVEKVMAIADFAAVLVQAGQDLGLVKNAKLIEPGRDEQGMSRDRGSSGRDLKF